MIQQDYFVDPEAMGGVVQLRAANRARPTSSEHPGLRRPASPASRTTARGVLLGRTHRQGATARQRLVVRVRENSEQSTARQRAGPAGHTRTPEVQRPPLASTDNPSMRRS